MQLGPQARIGLLVLSYAIIAGWIFVAAHEPSKGDMQALNQRGHVVWRQKGCGSCHALFGLGGHAGPDLTNAMRRRGRDYVDAAIVHGVGRMPPQKISAADQSALLAFLAHIDSLATYPLPTFPEEAFGRIAAARRASAAHRSGS